MQKYVESLPPGIHSIRSKMAEIGYNTKTGELELVLRHRRYSSWDAGTAVVGGDAAHRTFSVDFECKFYDRREYDCHGSFKWRFS